MSEDLPEKCVYTEPETWIPLDAVPILWSPRGPSSSIPLGAVAFTRPVWPKSVRAVQEEASKDTTRIGCAARFASWVVTIPSCADASG